MSHRLRGSMTISPSGKTGNFGPWTNELEQSKSPHVAKVARELDSAMQIALRLHSLNRAAVEKRGPLPEPESRRAAARNDQRALAKIQERLTAVHVDSLKFRQSLAPFDYPMTSTDNSTRSTFAARQELRSVLRSMSPQARIAALAERVDFRAAALEQPPQASGLGEADYNAVFRAELAARYPNELLQIAETDQALEAVRATISTVSQAINNELAAVGAPATEPAPQPAPTDF